MWATRGRNQLEALPAGVVTHIVSQRGNLVDITAADVEGPDRFPVPLGAIIVHVLVHVVVLCAVIAVPVEGGDQSRAPAELLAFLVRTWRQGDASPMSTYDLASLGETLVAVTADGS